MKAEGDPYVVLARTAQKLIKTRGLLCTVLAAIDRLSEDELRAQLPYWRLELDQIDSNK